MKLQRSTLILLAAALLLGGFVYVFEQSRSQQEQAQVATKSLFSFKEADVQALTVTTRTQTLSFVKTASQPAAGKSPQPGQSPPPSWTMTAPQQSPVNDASIAFLLNLMATEKRQQTLTIPVAKQAEFGFNPPLATVEVKLNNQTSHRLILGNPNFNRSAVYAQVDPPANSATDLSVVLVGIDFETAVTRPLAEWQAPKATSTSPQPKQPKPSPSR